VRLLAFLSLSELWAAPSAVAEKHAASITQLIFPLINFLIFVYLLKRFLMPFVKGHLRSRREEIAAAVKEADEARARAEALLRDYRRRLARLDEEGREIRDALSAEGERGKLKLIADAEELARRIKADADFLAEQEVKLARQQLMREIARLAREDAEKLVQGHLNPADQKRLVKEFLSGVGEAR
jgi:F-type H+-transporting ATPase subunit b